ncbi:MAG: sodium-dependent transporter [Christensenella sp.]|uniref:sodium-dependent transporter n=1 Tax=Christensenella sp. TaxID=1935934 RepID=UPI002B20E0BE|nr:sodium-dependent transporter [Christensenella sp.]MEA5004474.1 sodium-dependent transporter [Christensenella sp.]
MKQRETFGSRIGFILISAGCAIGLGNVWRFPYIVGQYGGAAFIIIFLFFLVILGLPILVMEFSVGRASKKSVARSFQALEPKGSKWHFHGYIAIAGNYLLMMFYTTIAGWMAAYLFKTAAGDFAGLSAQGVAAEFAAVQADPMPQIGWMVLITALGFIVCALGVRKGLEKVSKFMMTSLLVVMVVLVIRAVTLPGAQAGIEFYLKPDFSKLMEHGLANVIFAAMGQAFFTLSVGIGSMAIFGSYLSRERRLFGESLSITALDTFVALLAGLIIFPACFSFGVNPGEGPGLIFVTLPNIFNSMPGGQVWGIFFYIFMVFAAFSTVIAVFENILSFGMDLFGWSRRKSALINTFLMIGLALPCVLGFNLLSGFAPLGPGSTILDLENFIVSNNLLPLGSLVYLLFCTTRYGWGWEPFIAEANTGRGLMFPSKIQWYCKYVLPFIILYIFVQGYILM